MRIYLSLVASLCILGVVLAQTNNKKKFGSSSSSGGNSKPSNPDYDPPGGGEDYEGDALYYEDYDESGAKKDKDAVAADKEKALAKEKLKPSTPRPAAKEEHKDEHKDGGHASLFAPRRNRTPFVPRPASKPKPTLPSFIKKPVDPGSITTPRAPPSRAATFSATTAKTVATIRATTSRPSRFKNGGGSENNNRRTTSSPSTTDDRNRRFGSSSSRANVKPQRGNFRNPTN